MSESDEVTMSESDEGYDVTLFDVDRIPEPKLHQFDTGGEPLVIDFIAKLGTGLHSHVWKARINGNIYALKLFTNFQDSPPKPIKGMFDGDAGWWPYMHAFPNECRAFARLKEFGQEHLAVPCYGWVELDESHYAFMDSHIDPDDWTCELDIGRKRYAIVKEFVDFPTKLTCKHADMLIMLGNPRIAKKALKGIKTLHDLGILVGDIKEDNFSGGKHVDFSRARTAPHPALPSNISQDRWPYVWTVEGGAVKDAFNLEQFVHGEGGWNELFPANKIWFRLFPNPHYIRKLRSSKGLKQEWPGHPEHFSYKKAKKLFGRVKDSARQSEPLGPLEYTICKDCKIKYPWLGTRYWEKHDAMLKSLIEGFLAEGNKTMAESLAEDLLMQQRIRVLPEHQLNGGRLGGQEDYKLRPSIVNIQKYRPELF